MKYSRWILGIAVLIVLITLGSLPFVWPHPEQAIAAGTYALAIATLLLAVVAVTELEEGQKRAQKAQKQAEDTLRSSVRPLLIPLSSPAMPIWPVSQPYIKLRNVGRAVATNVRG